MSGYRRAAVELYGLPPADQDWVLSALPVADKVAIRQCLDELKELGFDGGMFPAPEALSEQPEITPPRSDLRSLHHATAAQMMLLIKGEPDGIIGQLLAIEEWPWATECIRQFPAVRQARIRAATACASSAALARNAFLLAAFTSRFAGNDSSNSRSADMGDQSIRRSTLGRMFAPVRRMAMAWTR